MKPDIYVCMKMVYLAAAMTLLSGIAAAQQSTNALAFPFHSTAFEDGGVIPDKYTQQGSMYVSPELNWQGAPQGTRSFALLVHDPDVGLHHSPDDVLHWLIFNIPGTATGLPEGLPKQGNLPDGAVQPKGTGGIQGYMGPGAGVTQPYHHYLFELYALDTMLSLGPDSTRDAFLKAIDGHVLGKTVLVGRFHKH
jgi:Raf kinase inhibitor-like YbhB/YbcL family protein